MAKQKTGVQEWAKHSFNFQIGCKNDCKYCYAQKMAKRFNKDIDDWSKPKHHLPESSKKLLTVRAKGTIMFPTTHDFSIENIEKGMIYLFQLVKNGNKVLVVSKMKDEYIRHIIDLLDTDKKSKENVEFRITIGSDDDSILKEWEPNAPTFWERHESLIIANKRGYKTSVSCEPMLDWIEPVILKCRKYVSNGIWLGFMNGHNGCKITKKTNGILGYLRMLRFNYGNLIHFKDSIIKAFPDYNW